MTSYQQLLIAKKEIQNLKKDIKWHINRINFVVNNIKNTEYNQDIIKLIKLKYKDCLSLISCLDLETFDIINEDNSEKLNKEIKTIFLEAIRDIMDIGDECGFVFDVKLNNIVGMQNYEILKKLSDTAILNMFTKPKKVIENTLNCKLVEYELDEKFDKKTMNPSFAMEHQIDDPKLLKDVKLGTFVAGTELPAIIDKDTNETYVKADVGIFRVSLSPRLDRFHFVK